MNQREAPVSRAAREVTNNEPVEESREAPFRTTEEGDEEREDWLNERKVEIGTEEGAPTEGEQTGETGENERKKKQRKYNKEYIKRNRSTEGEK